VVGDVLRGFKRAVVLQVRGEAGRSEGMVHGLIERLGLGGGECYLEALGPDGDPPGRGVPTRGGFQSLSGGTKKMETAKSAAASKTTKARTGEVARLRALPWEIHGSNNARP
jgi:hypothetical protein